MPYASVRASRHTRIGGGPVFWLVVGPFVLAGYMLAGLYIIASLLVVTLATAIGGLLRYLGRGNASERDAKPINNIDTQR